MNVTRGGLLVALAVFGVIAYELRTVAETVGVSVPLVPYMLAVVGAAALVVVAVWFTDGWHSPTDDA